MADLSLSKLPWKAQLAIFVVLSIAGGGAYLLLPRHAGAGARRGADERAREDSREDRQGPRHRAAAAGVPQGRVATCRQRLESLRPILPEEKDAADLLRRVHTLAVESNLTIRGFKPQAITTRELHAEWPISLELEGTYHNLGMFLDRVSKFPRIINVERSGDCSAGPKVLSSQTIAVTCTATTFVLLDPEALAAAQPKKAAKKAPKKTA